MALVKISKSVEKILEKVMGKGAKAAANTAEEAVKVAAHNGRRLGKVFVGAKKITLKEAKQRIQVGDFFNRGKNVSRGSGNTVSRFNFGKYLKNKIGGPPSDMKNPHAHHILFKKGLGEAQKALVKDGQEILRKHGIDPIYGVENLCWAPNGIKGQHSIDALKNVVDKLKAVDAIPGCRKQDIVNTLQRLGKIAAERGKT